MLAFENINFVVFDKEKNTQKKILQDITLQIPKGKITVITGHNGSGKSTLVKLVMGIIKPTSGKILLEDKNITDLSIDERANLGITMAFQNPIKFKGITVKDLLNIASDHKNTVDELCAILAQVGLCARDYIDRDLDDKLSGGELKRIELACALAKGGDVLLFDEPEAGIDLWSFDDLIKIFENQKGKTVLIVSHQKRLIEMADYVLLMNSAKEPILDEKEKMIALLENPQCRRLGGVMYE